MKKLLTIFILVVIMIALSYMGKVSAVSVTSTDIGSKFDEYSFLNDYRRKYVRLINKEYDGNLILEEQQYNDDDSITLLFRDANIHTNTEILNNQICYELKESTFRKEIKNRFSLEIYESEDFDHAISASKSMTALFGPNTGYASAQVGFNTTFTALGSFGELKECSMDLMVKISYLEDEIKDFSEDLKRLYNNRILYENNGEIEVRYCLSPGIYGLKFSYNTNYRYSITFKKLPIYNVVYKTTTIKKLFQKAKTITTIDYTFSGRFMYVIDSVNKTDNGMQLFYYNGKYYSLFNDYNKIEYISSNDLIDLKDTTLYYDFSKPFYDFCKID